MATHQKPKMRKGSATWLLNKRLFHHNPYDMAPSQFALARLPLRANAQIINDPATEKRVYNERDRAIILAARTYKKKVGEAVRTVCASKTQGEAFDALMALHRTLNEIEAGEDGSYGIFENYWMHFMTHNLSKTPVLRIVRTRLRMFAMQREILPWNGKTWWRTSPYWILHCVRPSASAPGMLEYYPDGKKFERDIVVSLKPGRYLEKYFGKKSFNGAILDEAQIRTYATQFISASRGYKLHMTDAPTKENFRAVGEEWKRIYEEGPGTCMQGMAAVRIYSYPGNTLRLAFFTENDVPTSTPIARTIVRDDYKQWLRAYPDDGSALQIGLISQLEQLGYSRGNLDGVKLRLLRSDGAIVCPYIDCGNNGRQTVAIESDHLLCGEGDRGATQTSGYLDDEIVCVCCEEGVDEENAHYCNNDGPYCSDCFSEHYVYAYIDLSNKDYVPTGEAIYCESTEDWYHTRAVGECGIHPCVQTGLWFTSEELVSCYEGYVAKNHAVQLSRPDTMGNEYAAPKFVVETDSGEKLHISCGRPIRRKRKSTTEGART